MSFEPGRTVSRVHGAISPVGWLCARCGWAEGATADAGEAVSARAQAPRAAVAARILFTCFPPRVMARTDPGETPCGQPESRGSGALRAWSLVASKLSHIDRRWADYFGCPGFRQDVWCID